MPWYDRELAKNPDNLTILRGRAFHRLGALKYEDRDKEMQRVIDLDPKNPLLHVERAFSRLYDDPEASITDCERALALDPKCVAAYAGRAELRDWLGKSNEALADWNRAIELSPKNAELYELRGTTREESGDSAGALSDFNQSIALNPKSDTGFAARGRNKDLGGDLDAAFADYSRAIELQPLNTDAHSGRGSIHYRSLRYEEASADLMVSAAGLASEDYDWFFAYASEVRCGRAEAARAPLRERMQSRKALVMTSPWTRAVGAFLLGDIEESTLLAATAKGDADDLKDRQCEAWYYAAIAKLAAGKKEEAIERFRKCVATGAEDNFEMEFAKADLKALGAK